MKNFKFWTIIVLVIVVIVNVIPIFINRSGIQVRPVINGIFKDGQAYQVSFTLHRHVDETILEDLITNALNNYPIL